MIELSGDSPQGPKKYARQEMVAMWLEVRASVQLNPKVDISIKDDIKFKLFVHYQVSKSRELITLGDEYRELLNRFEEKVALTMTKNKWTVFSWEDAYSDKVVIMFTGETGENLLKVWKN